MNKANPKTGIGNHMNADKGEQINGIRANTKVRPYSIPFKNFILSEMRFKIICIIEK